MKLAIGIILGISLLAGGYVYAKEATVPVIQPTGPIQYIFRVKDDLYFGSNQTKGYRMEYTPKGYICHGCVSCPADNPK